MPNPHLLYFADPMCSWCWGFAPVIEAITSDFGDDLPIHVVVGGLRPGTNEALTDPGRAEIRSHWTHMHAATGQPFDFRFFDREDFVYDTEPAARAVVVLPGWERQLPAFTASNEPSMPRAAMSHAPTSWSLSP